MAQGRLLGMLSACSSGASGWPGVGFCFVLGSAGCAASWCVRIAKVVRAEWGWRVGGRNRRVFVGGDVVQCVGKGLLASGRKEGFSCVSVLVGFCPRGCS